MRTEAQELFTNNRLLTRSISWIVEANPPHGPGLHRLVDHGSISLVLKIEVEAEGWSVPCEVIPDLSHSHVSVSWSGWMRRCRVGLSRELNRRNLLMVPQKFMVSICAPLFGLTRSRCESSVSQVPCLQVMLVRRSDVEAQPSTSNIGGWWGPHQASPVRPDQFSSTT